MFKGRELLIYVLWVYMYRLLRGYWLYNMNVFVRQIIRFTINIWNYVSFVHINGYWCSFDVNFVIKSYWLCINPLMFANCIRMNYNSLKWMLTVITLTVNGFCFIFSYLIFIDCMWLLGYLWIYIIEQPDASS